MGVAPFLFHDMFICPPGACMHCILHVGQCAHDKAREEHQFQKIYGHFSLVHKCPLVVRTSIGYNFFR